MINYAALLKQLKEQDEYIISKLSIYYELSALTNVEELAVEEVDEIVEYLHNIYMNNEDMSYRYPKLAEAVAEVCDYDLQELLSSIQKNGTELEEQILTQMIFNLNKLGVS